MVMKRRRLNEIQLPVPRTVQSLKKITLTSALNMPIQFAFQSLPLVFPPFFLCIRLPVSFFLSHTHARQDPDPTGSLVVSWRTHAVLCSEKTVKSAINSHMDGGEEEEEEEEE